MTKLNLFDLETVIGGEESEQYTYYWDAVMALWKMTGKTLEQLLSELRAIGRPQEMIDYIIANW